MSEEKAVYETEKKSEKGLLFVSGNTPSKTLASSIFASCTKENLDKVRVRGVGAGAINQMVKATIIAKSYLLQKGVKLEIDMCFKDVDNNISAVEFELKFEK